MKATLLRARERFDALSLRERLMVFVACLAVGWFVIASLLVRPLVERNAATRERIVQQEKLLAATEEAIAALARARTDPDAALRARRDELTRAIEAIDTELDAAARGLVPAERMPALVERIVARDRRLQVVSVRTLAPAPLVERGQEKPAPAADAGGIWRHGIEITVAGSYADLTDYVAALERLPTRMYWGRAVMQADYPRVTLSLTLYTLSLERAWLRV